MNTTLRDELLAMAEEDRRVRAELMADGSLGDGYHPRMEEVHRRNASRLTTILEEHGWPGRTLVGEEGAHPVEGTGYPPRSPAERDSPCPFSANPVYLPAASPSS